MTVNWWTLVLQAINFLVLVWLLQRFLYKPVLAIIAKRKEQVEQAFEETSLAKEAAALERRKFEDGQAALAQSRQELIKRTHAELAAEREQILKDTRTEVAAMLDGAREQIETERANALAAIKTEIADTAVDMATSLLRSVAQELSASEGLRPVLTESFLAQTLELLAQRSDEERRSLCEDVNGSTEGLRVVTSMTLNPAEQVQWRDAIDRKIGPLKEVTFRMDPEIVGGVELHFPHAVLSLAWSELLQQGKRALLVDEADH